MFAKSMIEMEDSQPFWFNKLLSNKKLKSGQSSLSGLALSQTSINSFVFLILSNLHWRRSKTATLCISRSWLPHSNE